MCMRCACCVLCDACPVRCDVCTVMCCALPSRVVMCPLQHTSPLLFPLSLLQEDGPPDGVDKLLYDRVLGLRERRGDVEEKTAECNKSVEDYRRQVERFVQKEKG